VTISCDRFLNRWKDIIGRRRDFFLTYSSKLQAMADSIRTILNRAGATVFDWQQDFVAGKGARACCNSRRGAKMPADLGGVVYDALSHRSDTSRLEERIRRSLRHPYRRQQSCGPTGYEWSGTLSEVKPTSFAASSLFQAKSLPCGASKRLHWKRMHQSVCYTTRSTTADSS